MLIVFEGIDGCGKDTQINLLRDELQCQVFHYPTSKYQILRDHLDRKLYVPPKSLFLLFLADIVQEQDAVSSVLKSKKPAVLGRYVFSTIAYEVDGIDFQRGKAIVESVGYLKPDHVFLLDIDPGVSQARKTHQKPLDRYEENISYLENVRSNFLKLAEERFLTPNWHKIDASRSVEEVNAEIMAFLQ